MRQTQYFLIVTLLLSTSALSSVMCIPDDYNTIQEALLEADTGDTLLVQAGTYKENIIWPEVADIVLVSEIGSGQTTIDGDGSGTVITFSSALVDTNTIVSGFTIRNGTAEKGSGIHAN